MDGVLLDLRQKRPDQEGVKRDLANKSHSYEISLSEWKSIPQAPLGFTESQKMPLKCPDCGKSFSHSSSLKRHSRTHTGVRPFVCNICSKGFHYKNNLQDHCRTHTGEKPFKCPDCGQSFAQSSTLNRHIGTHGKDRTCHICGKAFMKLSLLQKHISSHVGKKNCSFGAEDIFSLEKKRNSEDSCQLTKNMKLNDNEVCKEMCSKCGLKFKEASDLQQHVWCHVGGGQTLYDLAALSGLFNMYEVLKYNVSQSRG